ncbi:MAG: hypothetical protein WCI73_05720, partial [Phycisphaerae bacterium]
MDPKTVSRPFRNVCLGFALINTGATLLFAILLFVVPEFSKLDTRIKFTELDRAGVVNASAFKQFHKSYGFGDSLTLEYRSTVPVYIAKSPLEAEER